jgi:hypothetical protein
MAANESNPANFGVKFFECRTVRVGDEKGVLKARVDSKNKPTPKGHSLYSVQTPFLLV